MAISTDIRTFSEGMNLDFDFNTMLPGMYRLAINMHLSPSGNTGTIVTADGNELHSIELPEGGNKVIGSREYEKGSRNFYLVWNENLDHTVLMYNYETNEISIVFQDPILGFTSEDFITGINITKLQSNTLLTWSDVNGEPKKIGVESGLRTYDPVLGVYKGTWGVGNASFLEGEVVKYTFTDLAFYGRTLYYVAITDTTNPPFTGTLLGSKDPAPSEDWLLASPGYVYPDPSDIRTITQMPEAPLGPPTVTYMDNANEKTNRLATKMWQFKYKYVYADGQPSAWSPISKVPIPSSVLNPLDTGYVDQSKDNQINVGIPISSNANIAAIQVASRFIEDSRGPSNFVQFSEFRTDDLTLTWDFIGSESGVVQIFTNKEEAIPIDQNDSNQLFYWVPRKNRSQSTSGDNRMLFSNGEWGYPLSPNLLRTDVPVIIQSQGEVPDLNDLIYPRIGVIPNTPTQITTSINVFDTANFGPLNTGDRIRVVFEGFSFVTDQNDNPYPRGFPDNGISKFSFDETYTVSLNDFNNNSILELQIKVAYDIGRLIKAQYVKQFGYQSLGGKLKQHDIYRHQISGDNSGTTVKLTIEYLLRDDRDYWVSTTIEQFTAKLNIGGTYTNKEFKRGATETFAIAYSGPFGRISTASISDSFQQHIPWYNPGSSSAGNGGVSLQLELYHQPPEWAVKYHILKKLDNGITSFIQLALTKGNGEPGGLNEDNYFINGSISIDGTAVIPNEGIDLTCIFLNGLNGVGSRAYNKMVPNSILSYDFTPGDRLRFISTANRGAWYDEDVEILGYNATHNYIIINRNQLDATQPSPNLTTLLDDTNQSDGGTPSSASGALFEIYTPSNAVDTEGYYYETGIALDVVNGEHIGSDGLSQDYDTDTPALIDLDCGEVYYKSRWYATGGDLLDYEYILEDYNFNDAYKSRAHNVGRYNLSYDIPSDDTTDLRSGNDGVSTKPSTVFFSQPYIQGTDVNRIGSVYDINFKTFDDGFNSIQHIESEGDRILFWFEDRVGWAMNSLYVTSATGADGKTIVSGASSPAVSDITYYKYKGGVSLNPESVVPFQSRYYWFDMRRGVVCRLSQNGVTEISIGFIDSFIKTISDAMLSGVNKDIAIGAMDRRWQEFVLNLKWSTQESVPFELIFGPDNYYGLNFDTLVAQVLSVTDDLEIPSVYMSQFVPGTILTFIGEQTGNVYNAPIKYVSGNVVAVDIFEGGTYPVYDTSVRVPVMHSITLTYSDKLRVWSSIFTYIPDFMSSAGMDLITWKNGQLYEHNSKNVAPLNYYGEDKYAILGTIGNSGNVAAKTWLTLGIQTNDLYNVAGEYKWSTPERGIYTQGQRSDLQTSDFTLQEGTMYAPFLKNIDTPNFDTEFQSRLEGEDLKGRYIYTQLKIEGITTPREVFTVLYRFNLSDLVPSQ